MAQVLHGGVLHVGAQPRGWDVHHLAEKQRFVLICRSGFVPHILDLVINPVCGLAISRLRNGIKIPNYLFLMSISPYENR